MMQKYHSTAPLPFVGQKRYFIKHFTKVLSQIPADGKHWTIVDVFGGSGLLAHVAKRIKPQARVIYNDYDNYSDRLRHIPDYNCLREQIAQIVGGIPKGSRLDPERTRSVQQTITNFQGHIDVRVLSSWLLFSAKQANSLEQLLGFEFYNKVRQSPYSIAADYLDGLEITRQDYNLLMAEHQHNPNTLLVLDPPYVSTAQGAYAADKYFNMVSFLRMIQYMRPPFILFSSTRSEALDYFQFLQECEPDKYRRFSGYNIVSLDAKMGKGIEYQDNMIYKID